MSQQSSGKAGASLEKLLKLLLVTILLVNLALFFPGRDLTLRLDLISPVLPAISVDLPRLTDLPVLRSLASQWSQRASAQGSSPFVVWIGPSAAPSAEGAQPPQTDFAPIPGAAQGTLTPPAGASPLSSATQLQAGTISPSATSTFSVTTSVTAASSTTPSATSQPTASSTPSPPTPTVTADSGAIHYVATNGNDSGPGSSSQPWRTIQKAASSLGPGSTAIVLSGDYPERVQVTRSGSSGAPITFKAQGTVTMQGFTVDADYISIVGFDISNTPDNWKDGIGIFLQGGHCDIEDNYVHFATRGGITLWAEQGDYGATSNCTIKNNRLYRNAMAGIEVYGQDNLVDGNEIWGTIQHHPNWANPPGWVDADGMRVFGSSHTIKRNYIHDITYAAPENVDPHIDCFQTWSDSNHDAAKDVVFEQNTCVNLDAQSSDEVGQGFMLERAGDLTIRNNIIVAFRILNSPNSHDLTITNNTFVGSLSSPSRFSPGGVIVKGNSGITIQNNVFYNIPNRAISSDGSERGLDVGYNCVYRSDGAEPQGSPYPNDLWNVDPRFKDADSGNYHLRSGSPLIDAGAELGSVKRDFDGNRRPQGAGYDIGAFEAPQ